MSLPASPDAEALREGGGLKPIAVTIYFPRDMDVGSDRARWYIDHALRGYWQTFVHTETDPIRGMARCVPVIHSAGWTPPAPKPDTAQAGGANPKPFLATLTVERFEKELEQARDWFEYDATLAESMDYSTEWHDNWISRLNQVSAALSTPPPPAGDRPEPVAAGDGLSAEDAADERMIAAHALPTSPLPETPLTDRERRFLERSAGLSRVIQDIGERLGIDPDGDHSVQEWASIVAARSTRPTVSEGALRADIRTLANGFRWFKFYPEFKPNPELSERTNADIRAAHLVLERLDPLTTAEAQGEEK